MLTVCSTLRRGVRHLVTACAHAAQRWHSHRLQALLPTHSPSCLQLPEGCGEHPFGSEKLSEVPSSSQPAEVSSTGTGCGGVAASIAASVGNSMVYMRALGDREE